MKSPAAPPPPDLPARSIRRVIISRFGLAATVPLLAAAAIHGWLLAAHTRSTAEGELTHVAQSITQRIDSHLGQHRQIIATLADQLAADRLLTPPRLAAALDLVRTHNPGLRSLLVADSAGRVLATAPAAAPEPLPPSVADRDYFQQPLATRRPFLSSPRRDHHFGPEPTIALSAPVRDAPGSSAALVAGSLDLTRLRRLCLDAASEEPIQLILIDAARQVVFSSLPDRYPALAPLDATLAATLPTAPGLVVDLPATSPATTPHLVAHFPLQPAPGIPAWSLIVLQDTATAYADTRTYATRVTLATAVALLLALLFSRRLVRDLTTPIEALSASIDQFSPDRRVPLSSPLAIGDFQETARLWRGFTAMAARLEGTYTQLAHSQAELRQANAGLENEVAHRTSELADELERRSLIETELRRLALIVEHTSNIAVITDAAGRIEWTNPAFTRITGYTLAEVKGRKPGSFLQGPATDPATIAHIRTCLAAGTGFHAELLNYAKDGRTYWLSIEAQPVRDASGTTVNFIAIETDISERKHAQAELLAYRDRLDLALEAARTCTWEFDPVTNRVTLDPRWAALLGTPATTCSATTRQMLAQVHPDDRHAALLAAQSVHHGDLHTYEVEQRIRHAAGHWVWILSIGRVISRDSRGIPTRIIGVNRDITSRKHAAACLLRQKEFLSTLQETTLDLLARRDLKDVFQTLITHASVILRAPVGELLLHDDGDLVICAHTHSPAFSGPLRVGRKLAPLSWRAFDTGRPVVVDDYATSPDRVVAPEIQDATTVALIPILHGTTSVAVLALGRLTPADPFTPEDLADCTHLAQMAALVLHNAGLRAAALREASDRTAALRESEERFRGLFDQSPAIILLASLPSGTIAEINSTALTAFGYTRDEAIGRTSPELGLWQDPAERERYLTAVRTDGSVRNFEALMHRRDGTTFPVLCHGSLVTIGGRPYSLNSLEDITERRRTELARREGEERFRSIFDSSPVPITLAEFPSGRIIAANDATLAIWALPRTAVLGRTGLELGLWADLAERTKFYELMRRDGAVSNFETRLCRPDGHSATVLFSATIVTISGRPYSLNTVLDITARKASELARDSSLALMRATLESTADGILVIGTDGHVETYNGIFAQMWRLPPASVTTADHHDVLRLVRAELTEPDNLPPNLGDSSLGSDRASLTTLVCTDGRIYECYSRPQLVADRPTGRVWSFRDVTSHRRAEEERLKLEEHVRQSQKMESLGTLAGGIAHDFNNILTGILGFTDLAQVSLEPGHPAHECLEHVLRSSTRARELVRQILTFSRSTHSERVPHRLHLEISEALQLLRSTLPAMVELERRIDPKTSPVLADATQIHQVVMNLCTNAWHALPPTGGRITVTLAPHLVTPAEAATNRDLTPGHYVRLSVSDTGCGMSPATLQHIFEPFFTTKEVGKGTGLGLAVVHGVMKTHQGAITVESKLGTGTTFHLSFPALLTPEAPAATAPKLRPPTGHGERILYVDDDPDSGLAIERLVTNLGYKVQRVTSPVQALQLFSAQTSAYALALVDLAMPAMSGDVLARHLLALRPELPVVMLTGFVEPERQATILASGVRQVLSKPPSVPELARALATHLAAAP